MLGRRGSPTGAALHDDVHAPSPGHTPVLVCVGADQQSYEAVVPATIMMNKATATTERHQTMTLGAAQLGIGQGVLDAVADGLLAGDQDTVVFVAIWIDDGGRGRDGLREAAAPRRGPACRTRPAGRARPVERLVRERDALANPFYGGE